MRLLTTNLVAEAATVITGSSESANFPYSNLKSPFRSKRWRPSGTFLVSVANNKINFKESAMGSELTATITAGSYTATSLATEIVTRLQAAGTKLYTCSFNAATGLWTIATTNGTYLSFLNTSGTNQSVNLLKLVLGFASADRIGALTYTGTSVAIHTAEVVTFDLITSQDINSVVVLWPKEDGILLSETAVLRVEGNATDSWTSPSVSQTLTIDNTYSVASHFFTSTQSYRYWRIVIIDPTNPNLFVELGKVWIGENLSFDEPENGFKFSITDRSDVVQTDYGHRYIDEYPIQTSLEFKYSYIQYATAQALDNAFRSNSSRSPVIVVLDQGASVFDKDHFLLYGYFEKSFDLNHVSYDMFNGGLKITEAG